MKRLLLIIACLTASFAGAQFFMFGPNGQAFQCPPTVTSSPASPPTIDQVVTNGEGLFTQTYSIATPSGNNRAMFVAFEGAQADVPSAVTYNGASMTFWGSATNGPYARAIAIYYVVAPATGAHTLDLGLAPNSFCQVIVLSLSGVSQSAPVGTLQTATGDAVSSEGLTVSSATSELVIDAMFSSAGDAAVTPAAGETLKANSASGNSTGVFVGSKTGAASTVMGYTFSGAYVAYMVGPIKSP